MSVFLPVIRVWRSLEDNVTVSEDVHVNFDHVVRFHPKAFFDTAEDITVTGTELIFVDGSRILVGNSMGSIANRL